MHVAADDLGMDAWPDDELFAAVRRGPEAPAGGPDRGRALEVLFARYHARVHAQCRRLLGDEGLADDLTQEIFLSFLEGPLRYDECRYFASWLHVVVRNRCLNVLRKRRREVPDAAPEETWESLMVAASDPSRDCERRETGESIRRACRQELTLREQEVIHLRYFWGLRVKEIDRVLGLENTSGARTHLATAHRKLRQALRARFAESALPRRLEGSES